MSSVGQEYPPGETVYTSTTPGAQNVGPETSPWSFLSLGEVCPPVLPEHPSVGFGAPLFPDRSTVYRGTGSAHGWYPSAPRASSVGPGLRAAPFRSPRVLWGGTPSDIPSRDQGCVLSFTVATDGPVRQRPRRCRLVGPAPPVPVRGVRCRHGHVRRRPPPVTPDPRPPGASLGHPAEGAGEDPGAP